MTAEVSSSANGAVPRTRNVEWKRYKEFSIRGGSFKAPISPDTIASPLFLDELERSILAQFVPNFELGIMVYGSIAGGLVTYGRGHNGRSYLAGQGRARNDDDESKEIIGRVTVAPFVGDGDSVLRLLRVGRRGDHRQRGRRGDAVQLQRRFDRAGRDVASFRTPATSSTVGGSADPRSSPGPTARRRSVWRVSIGATK